MNEETRDDSHVIAVVMPAFWAYGMMQAIEWTNHLMAAYLHSREVPPLWPY